MVFPVEAKGLTMRQVLIWLDPVWKSYAFVRMGMLMVIKGKGGQ
jgi:hypothetical protein